MSTTQVGKELGVSPTAELQAESATARPAHGQAEWLRPAVAWYAVALVAAVTVFGQLDRGIMSLLVGSIKRDTHMSDTELSLLMGMAYSLVYMCAGLPMARLSDVKRRTFILPAALAVWSLGTAFCGVAQSFWQFFIARGMVGGGESVKGPTSVSLIPDLVPREKLPRAFAIYNMAIMGGEALSMIIGGLLIGWLAARPPLHIPGVGPTHNWQEVFLIFGIPGLLVALLFVFTVPEPARHGRRHAGSAPIKEVARFILKGPASRVLLPIFIASAVNGVFTSGVGSWRPAFFERTYGLGPHEYGPIIGLSSLVTVPLGTVLGAFVIERMSRRWSDAHLRLVVIVHVCTMPFVILSPLMPTFPLALACQMVSSVLLMMSAPSQLAAMQIVTPNEMRGQVNACYMFTVSVIGAGLGPTVVALLTDYLFKAEAELRYAMVTAGVVATPIVLFCLIRAVRPFGRLHGEVIAAERAGGS